MFFRNRLNLTYFPDDELLQYYNKTEKYDKETLPKIFLPFKYYIVLYCLINFFVCLFFEKVVVAWLIKKWSKKEYNKNKERIRKDDIEPTLELIYDVKNYVKEHSIKRHISIIKN